MKQINSETSLKKRNLPDGFIEADPDTPVKYHLEYPDDFIQSPFSNSAKPKPLGEELISLQDNLNETFRKILNELFTDLLNIRQKCDFFDIHNSPTDEQQIKFLTPLKKKTDKTLTNSFKKLWEIARSLDENDYLNHKLFLQKTLLPILAVHPLNRRIYQKPLGYAGDFRMMEHYYRDDFEGDSTFDKLIHRYSLDLPVSRANINRRKILGEILEKTSSEKKYLKIASVGCGPAVEIFDFLEKKNQTQKCFITLLDSEISALKSLMKKISDSNYINNVNICFIQMDILRLLKRSSEYSQLENHDLIYSSGLFDYFSEKHAKKILKNLFSFLKPGGELVIVNVSESIEDVGFMELLGDWRLHLRKKEDMLALANELKCSHKDVFFDFENKKNIYLKLIK